MSESVEEYLARGGTIDHIPRGQGKERPSGGEGQGEQLRQKLHREAQNALSTKKATGVSNDE